MMYTVTLAVVANAMSVAPPHAESIADVANAVS